MSQTQTTIDPETLEHYRARLRTMSEAEKLKVAAEALYHLHVVSGSRNSFDWQSLSCECGRHISPGRTRGVEAAHHEAADFLAKYRA